MCALWFLRDFRNPTRTARGHERSAAPAREWFFAAAVIRCTWHSRRRRLTAAKPLPSTAVATGRREAIQDGARNWERLQDGEGTWTDREVMATAVRDLGRSNAPVSVQSGLPHSPPWSSPSFELRLHRDSHWTMAAKSTQAARQYSAASMIVRTRTVWRGSLGSSLPQVSVGS